MDSQTATSAVRGKREACDRCHNLKSRCIKPRHSSVCSRCQKLGVSCVYSPPLRVGRPKGKRNQTGEGRSRQSTEPEDEASDGCQSPLQQGQDFIRPENQSLTMTSGPECRRKAAEEEQSPHLQRQPEATSQLAPQTLVLNKTADLGLAGSTPHDEPLFLGQSFHSLAGNVGLSRNSDCMSIAQPGSPSETPDDGFMHWESDLHAADMLAGADVGLTGLLSMADWQPATDFDEQWKDQEGSRFEDGQESQTPSSSPNALEARNTMEELLNLQRDLYDICNSSLTKAGQAGTKGTPDSFEPNHGSIENIFAATERLVRIIYLLNGKTRDNPSRNTGIWTPSPTPREDSAPSMVDLTDSSTVLLILSCYLRLLDTYESLVKSLHLSHQSRPPGAGTPNPGMPIFAVGGFSLASSPDGNVALMITIVLEMVGRLKMAVRVCAVAAQSDFHEVPEHSRRKSHSTPRSKGLSSFSAAAGAGGRVDEAHHCSTGPATETFLRAMLFDVHAREDALIGNLYDLKQSVTGRSLDAFAPT